MIIYIFELLFVIFLFRLRSKNICYYILCTLQAVSFLLAPFVNNFTRFSSLITFFNLFYCFVILSLIIQPWRFSNFSSIYIKDNSFFKFYKRCLYVVLKLTILNNIVVFAIVLLFIPDIANFKASQGFHELYDQIPYFGLSFRYTSVSRYLGFMALPIWIYYLKVGDLKEARKALVLSSSTLVAAIAFYSRAQILIYTIIIVCLFFLIRSSLPHAISVKFGKIVRKASLVIAIFFAVITFLRFSGMDYYADRIPSNSLVQDPILYSVVDYTSKGFTNGLEQLELHESGDLLYGENCYQSLALALSYFHIIDWNAEASAERAEKVFRKKGLDEQNDEGSFHGYTCLMVKNFGYIFTLLINIFYFHYVRIKTINKKSITLGNLTILTFLLSEPIISIFYMDYDMMTFPLLFYILIRGLYKFVSINKIHAKTA